MRIINKIDLRVYGREHSPISLVDNYIRRRFLQSLTELMYGKP